MNITRRSLAASALGVAFLMAGCDVVDNGKNNASGGGADACKRSGDKAIGWDWPLSSLEIYPAFNAQVAAIAKKRGYKTVTTTNDGDLQQQINDLQTWVTQGLRAFGTYALEPSAIEPIAAQARNACVGFVSYGADMKNADASIAFAWDQSGASLGEDGRKWAIKNGGKLKALILHDRDITAGRERDEALMKEFPGDATNVEVVSHQRANDTASGEKITSTVLEAHPDLNMVLAYNDDVAIGARQAFINAGFDEKDPNVYIGGQDGTPAALKLLKENGIYRASSAVLFTDLTSVTANTIVDVAEQKKPHYPPLEFVVVTPDQPKLIEKFLQAYGTN